MIAPTNFLTSGGPDLDSIHEIADRPMDAARKIHQLITTEGKTWKRVMQMFSRSTAWIYAHKKLLDLHPDVQRMIPNQNGPRKGRPRELQTSRTYLGYSFAAPLSALPLDRQKEVADKICSEPQRFKVPKDVADYVSELIKENKWKRKKSELISWTRSLVVAQEPLPAKVAPTTPAVAEEILEFPSEPSDTDMSHKFVNLIDELEGILENFERSSPEAQEPSLYSLLQKIKLNPRRKLMAYMRKVGLILYYAGHDRES